MDPTEQQQTDYNAENFPQTNGMAAGIQLEYLIVTVFGIQQILNEQTKDDIVELISLKQWQLY